MKTMFRLWHWPQGTVCGQEQGLYDNIETAIAVTGVNDPARWKVSTGGARYVPLPNGDQTGCYQEWLVQETQVAENDTERIQLAVEIALDDGITESAHHKMWVIDQMLRTLLGERYEAAIAQWCDGEEGPETYQWDTGIAP